MKLDSVQYCDAEFHNEIFRRCNPEIGDVLLTKDGANTGNVAINELDEPFSLLSSVCLLKPDRAKVAPGFLFYYLQSEEGFEQITGQMTGAAIKRIILKTIKSSKMPLPPLPEQKRIIGILDEALAGIATAVANTEKNLANARELFDSYLNSVFSQRGEEWSSVRLGNICERVSVGHVGATTKFYCDSANGVPFLRSQNVRRGKIDWRGIRYITREFHDRLKKSQLSLGDLLFVRVGANRGDCSVVRENLSDLNCANIVFARLLEGNVNFLELYAMSAPGRTQLLGMTTGSAQGVINTKSVAELVIPYPCAVTQKEIVEQGDELAAETLRIESVYQQKLTALTELKQSLLQKAFSGELTAGKEAPTATIKEEEVA
jgi:type I restriction enzyme S subunit